MTLRISGDSGLLAAGLNTNLLGNTQLLPSQMPSGSIIQVVQKIKTDTFTTSGVPWVDITGMDATITLNNPNNKVLILLDMKVGTYIYESRLQMIKVNPDNSQSAINTGDLIGTRPPGTINMNLYGYDNAGTYYENYRVGAALSRFIDTPGTRNASVGPFTYKLQLASYSTYPGYINRSYIWQDSGNGDYDGTMSSTITLLEIAT
jgi:hypothetical protein